MNRIEYLKNYYQRNKQKIDKKNRKWVKDNPERSKIFHKKYKQTPKGIYQCLKINCYNKKRPFLLEKEDFINWYLKQEKICHYCGVKENEMPIIFKKVSVSRTGIVNRLTIDRKENKQGYIINNIVLSCSQCNRIKGEFLSHNEMLKVGKIVRKKWERLNNKVIRHPDKIKKSREKL